MSTLPEDSRSSHPRWRWPSLIKAHAHPPPDAGDCVAEFLLPWAGRLSRSDQKANDGQAAPPRPAPPFITAQGRDLRVDLLRGYFVFAMIIDHVSGPSLIQVLTGGNRFFTSAAEGFVLASGLMAGLIYHRLVARDGLGAAVRKVLARTFTLYLLTVGMTLLLVPISEAFGLPWAQGLDVSRPLEFVVSVLTLHRTYYLVDVLVLYTLLFALMPLALLLMERGQTRLLLVGSWLLWGLHQFLPNEVTVTWPIAGNYLFTISAWQVLFVSGLVLGYQRDRIPLILCRNVRRLQLFTGVGIIALVAGYLLLELPVQALPPQLAGISTALDWAKPWIQEYVFGKADLRPGRLVASAIVFTFLFLTLTRQWRYVCRPLEWLLAPLGQNALYAFTAHVAVVTGVALILTPLALAAASPQWLNAAIQVVSLLVVWLLTRTQALAPTPRTRSIWHASPAALAVLAVVALPLLPVHPDLVAPAPVSDAVLARARAYGTVVVRVNTPVAPGQAPAPRPTLAPPTAPPVTAPPLSPPSTPASPMGMATGTAAPMAQTEARLTPPPAATAPLATPAAAPSPAVAAPLETTPSRSSPQPTATAPPERTATATATRTATPVPLKPAPIPAQAEPLPPLPPDSERLKSPYVGQLAGRAYARTFRSQLLNRDMPYWVYLPPGYGTAGRRYPVLYMLHGGGGKLDEWAAYGLFDQADQEFRTSALPPYIIVLPQGDVSYWTNWANNSPPWGDYLAYEVVNQIDSAFGTLRSRAARGIGGLSMGGWGALYQAFTHGDIFGVVGAHSPSLYPDDNNLKFLGVGAEFASKEPLSLARVAPNLQTLRIWIDLGQSDPWADAATSLHNALQQRGIAHTWQLIPGSHAPEYWALHLPEYLQFYARTLAGQ